MPNRMLRDWTRSDKVDSLSFQAEVFLTRLIMKVDDYGCYWADTRLIKADLFPLRIDKIREADLSRWMAECQKAGVIVLYEHDNKKYLMIRDFRQRLDKAKSKFPLPTDKQPVNDFPEVVNDYPAEKEVEYEVEKEDRKRAFAPPSQDELIFEFSKKLDDFTAMGEADKFLNFYQSKGWMVGKTKMKDWKAAVGGWISRMRSPQKSTKSIQQILDEAKNQTL